MRSLLISATLAIFTVSASCFAEQISSTTDINLEPCEQLTKNAIVSQLPPQVTITLEEYKRSLGILGMFCWMAMIDGYDGKVINTQQLAEMSKEESILYMMAYDEGVSQRRGTITRKKKNLLANLGTKDFFYFENGFDTESPEEIKYAASLWDHVMKVAKTVNVTPDGEMCYLIVTHDRKGKITGTRDGGKSPGGNGPDWSEYCKAVESAILKTSMPMIPQKVKKDSDVLSLTYTFYGIEQ